ncbi:MAG: hypothetical protein ACKPKO_42265, partial [Candidatus Fonsibacter sp.]
TLPLLLRMVEPEEFSKYNSITPTTPDYLADYNDGIQRLEWQIDVSSASLVTERNPIIYRSSDTEGSPNQTQTAARAQWDITHSQPMY